MLVSELARAPIHLPRRKLSSHARMHIPFDFLDVIDVCTMNEEWKEEMSCVVVLSCCGFEFRHFPHWKEVRYLHQVTRRSPWLTSCIYGWSTGGRMLHSQTHKDLSRQSIYLSTPQIIQSILIEEPVWVRPKEGSTGTCERNQACRAESARVQPEWRPSIVVGESQSVHDTRTHTHTCTHMLAYTPIQAGNKSQPTMHTNHTHKFTHRDVWMHGVRQGGSRQGEMGGRCQPERQDGRKGKARYRVG